MLHYKIESQGRLPLRHNSQNWMILLEAHQNVLVSFKIRRKTNECRMKRCFTFSPHQEKKKILRSVKIHFGGRRLIKAKCLELVKVNTWPRQFYRQEFSKTHFLEKMAFFFSPSLSPHPSMYNLCLFFLNSLPPSSSGGWIES